MRTIKSFASRRRDSEQLNNQVIGKCQDRDLQVGRLIVMCRLPTLGYPTTNYQLLKIMETTTQLLLQCT